MGPSGSGKSTLLGLLAGLGQRDFGGKIILDGEDITGLSEDRMSEVRGRKIGFVFQSFQLIPTLTAEENVLLPAELAGADFDVVKARAGIADAGWTWRIAWITTRCSYPAESSSVWRWRGRSSRNRRFCSPTSQPAIWMARPERQVLEILLELNRREGATLVLVTHDQRLPRMPIASLHCATAWW